MKTNPCEQVFEKLLNPKEVGKLFGVFSATVLRMARAGRLPGVRFVRLWRFSVT